MDLAISGGHTHIYTHIKKKRFFFALLLLASFQLFWKFHFQLLLWRKKLSSIPSLHEFNPDTTTWTSYRDRMGFYFHANGIVFDPERKALFLWSIGDHVYGLLESLVAPRLLTEAELTYAKFN